jgi:5-methylcytosine-specific restriction endonuclease McrA
MSSSKRVVRRRFRDAVFQRDGHRCRVCGRQWRPTDADPSLHRINAHHITDRRLMPAGGYVAENGITVCEEPCHLRVEAHTQTGQAEPGLEPDALYRLIGSSHPAAVAASEALALKS